MEFLILDNANIVNALAFLAGPVSVYDGCGDGNVNGYATNVLAHLPLNGAAAVPEPGTLGLLGAGLIGLAWRRRRA